MEVITHERNSKKRGLIRRLLFPDPWQDLAPPTALLPAPKSMEINMAMRRVIVESPYGSPTPEGITKNQEYLQQCLQDCVRRGECPFASHGFFPFFLNEQDPKERRLGIELGYIFWDRCDTIVFYLDKGISPGMEKALSRAFELGIPIERRFLNRHQGRLTAELPQISSEEVATRAEDAVKQALQLNEPSSVNAKAPGFQEAVKKHATLDPETMKPASQ